MKTRHGVLTSEGLLVMNTAENRWENYNELDIVHQISDLMEIALAYGLTHLWVHREAGIADSVEFANFNPERWDLRVTWDRSEKNASRRIASSYGWKLPRGGQQDVTIVYPHNTKWAKNNKGHDSWGALASPTDLLTTVGYLEQALQVPVAGGASTVGWKLLRKLHGDWLENVKIDLRQLHFGKEAAKDMVWDRPLTEEEMEMLKQGPCYVHKVDRRSAYPAAAEGEFYGIGTPELIEGEASYARRVVNGKPVGHDRVGVYHCRVIGAGMPILNEHFKSGQYWIDGTMVRLLRYYKSEVEILEGWVFPDERQLLASWVRNKQKTGLWDVRESFRSDTKRWRKETPRQYAELASKQIAVATLGLTSFRRFGSEEETDKKRNDIKTRTVGRNYELMYHNIVKTAQEDNKWPVMTYFDAMYYVSSERDPMKVFPTLLARKEGPGSYKYEGCIEMTPEVVGLLNIRNAVASKLEILNKIGWEK